LIRRLQLTAHVEEHGAMSATAIATVSRRIIVSDDRQYLTIGQLCERYSCSRMWIERRLKAASLPFPTPLKFGGPTSARRWRLSEVEQWEIAKTKANEKTTLSLGSNNPATI
jgi:predicted DNA-binding transcriptional regulator AlpA